MPPDGDDLRFAAPVPEKNSEEFTSLVRTGKISLPMLEKANMIKKT